MAMREVLPLRELVKVVARGLHIDDTLHTAFQVTIWEDNMGCLTLANLDPGQSTPRSKFYDSKVHWFRSKLDHETVVKKIESALQLSDTLTKPLPKDVFETLRKMLQGW